MQSTFALHGLRTAVFLVLIPGAVCAASAASPDTITVTGTRSPVRASEQVAEVTVIDRAAIERAQGLSLSQLLVQQAGLQLSSNGGLGKTASVFIRGLEARHTLLLVDGMPVGSATVGSPSLDNLPLELIERIEIVRGPMSSLYGNGAMGGVVQLFTRKAPQGLGASALVAAGTQHQAQAGAGVSWGGGGLEAIASAQRQTTRGQSATNPSVPFGSYNDDLDGFRQTSGSLKLGWQINPAWRLDALSLRSDGETQLDDGPGADARALLRNEVHRLSADTRLAAGWTTQLSLSQSTDAYDTRASASPFASLGTILTRQNRLAWEHRVQTPVGQALGLLERTRQTVGRPGTPFDESERNIDALALGLTGQAAGHSWQASLRRDRNPQSSGVTTGAAGWGYAFTPAWRVLASAGTSHTLPSFNQLYFPGFGNPNLLPEEGRHAELGLQWTGKGQQLRAAWYEHRYRGFISAGPQPQNLPKATIDGVTLSWQAQWQRQGQAWSLDASLDHTDPRNTTSGNANDGKLLPRRAQDALRVGLQWDAAAWSLGAQAAAFSHRFDNAANTVRLGGYATLDLSASWALQRDLTLRLALSNVGDRRYQTALGYDQPGRAALLSLRYRLR